MARSTALSVAVWVTSAALLRVFTSSMSPLPFDASPHVLITSVTNNAVLTLGAAICLWYLVTATALLASEGIRIAGFASTGLDRAVRRVGAPFLRKVALWGTVGSLALGSSTAAVALTDDALGAEVSTHISTAPLAPQDSRNANYLIDLGWPVLEPTEPALPSTGIPESEETEVPPPEPTGIPAPAQPTRAVHIVEEGDTLWAIAAAQLRAKHPDPTPAQIAQHWPTWYAENIDVIGPNPDLITPGLRLNTPSLEES